MATPIGYAWGMATVALLHGSDVYRELDAAGARMLVLTSAGCGACRAMRAALAKLPELPFPLRVLVVDAGSHRGLVEEHGAVHLPSLHLYRDGDYWGEVQAPPQPVALAAAIVALAAGPPGDLPG